MSDLVCYHLTINTTIPSDILSRYVEVNDCRLLITFCSLHPLTFNSCRADVWAGDVMGILGQIAFSSRSELSHTKSVC